MIEAYAKNVGLKAAKFKYVCITNCDILFNSAFFDLCGRLDACTFYRFIEYEVPPVQQWDLSTIEGTFAQAKCLNNELLDSKQWNLKNIAYKSGDAMLLDKESWDKIKGFPENEVWVHSDLIVCNVINNNRIPLRIEKDVKIYTYPQERTLVERDFELPKTYEYISRTTCN
jgi:hypothetical protein